MRSDPLLQLLQDSGRGKAPPNAAYWNRAMMIWKDGECLPIHRGCMGQCTSLQETVVLRYWTYFPTLETTIWNHHCQRPNAESSIMTATFMLHLKCPSTSEIIAVNALADISTTDFLLDTSLGDRLSITRQSCLYDVVAHHGQETHHDAIMGHVVCIDPETKEEYDFQYYAYEGPSDGLYPEDWSQLKFNFEHLVDLDVPAPIPGWPIKAIVGCRYASLLYGAVMRGKYDDHIAVHAPLGMLVFGKTSKTVPRGQARSACGTPLFHGLAMVNKGCVTSQANFRQWYGSLRLEMESLWGSVSMAEREAARNQYFPPVMYESEKKAEELFIQTIRFSHGKYQVRLPWRTGERPKENYKLARILFLQLEKQLMADEAKRVEFHDLMKAWIADKFLEESKGGGLWWQLSVRLHGHKRNVAWQKL